MRIEGTSGLEGPTPLERQDAAQARPAAGKSPAEVAGDTAVQGDLQAEYLRKSFLEMAQSAPAVNENAVAEARRLLETGELDTPEAIDRAAERMLALGM